MRKISFVPDLAGLWRFLKDPKTDWKPKILSVLAVLYLFWPLDVLPDFAPIVGWMDDIGFIAVASGYLVHATNKFLDTKK
ncbi:MAG: DUF1232 domain-containing protein [Patescibacteria group bacterium]